MNTYSDDQHGLQQLIQDTVNHFVSPNAQVVEIEEQPIKRGLQAEEVYRHKVTLCDQNGESIVFLVTKKAGLIERRVLSRLLSQSANVPFHLTYDLKSEQSAYICMQDIDHHTDYGNLNIGNILISFCEAVLGREWVNIGVGTLNPYLLEK